MCENKKIPASIMKKIVAVRSEMPKIAQSGHCDFPRFDYSTEADVYEGMRPVFDRHDLFVSVEVSDSFTSQYSETYFDKKENKEKERIVYVSEVEMEITFGDVDSGDTATFKWKGKGVDSLNQSISKALTSGFRGFLLKMFLCEEGNDGSSETTHSLNGQNSKPQYQNNLDPNKKYNCSVCGVEINTATASFSQNRLGKFLCREHQK